MQISLLNSVSAIKSSKKNFKENKNSQIKITNTISEIKGQPNFCAANYQLDFVKELKLLLESSKQTPELFEEIFSKIPKDKQENIMKITEAFSNFGVTRNDVIKKVVTQLNAYTSNPDKVIDHINAHAFIERNKTGKSMEEIIPNVLEKKNLGQKNDSIYTPFLISQLFKSSKRPDCILDKGNQLSALKRYIRKNSDAELDTVEVIKDKMTPDFIDFVKRTSKEIYGEENKIKVKVISDKSDKKITLITEGKENPSITDIVKDMKAVYAQSGKIDNDIISLYKKLPKRCQRNLCGIIKILRSEGEEINPPMLMRTAIKYPAFFRKDAKDSVQLIKAKKFQLRDSGKTDATINTVIHEAYNEYSPNIIYSKMLVDKIFKNGTNKPWYLNAKGVDLSENLGIYLEDYHGKKITIDVIEDEMTEEFIKFAKNLSYKHAHYNVFDFNVINK